MSRNRLEGRSGGPRLSAAGRLGGQRGHHHRVETHYNLTTQHCQSLVLDFSS